MIDHEFVPPSDDGPLAGRDYCVTFAMICGRPRDAHRTAQTPTADATASARLTAEADADGTGSRVEEPERVCARCEGAIQKTLSRMVQHLAFNDSARSLLLDCEEWGRSACLAAHHASGDAALESVYRAAVRLGDAWERAAGGEIGGLNQANHDLWKALGLDIKATDGPAARLEGGKR